jgi:hypothetical protein
MSIAEAHARLTAPGQRFEMEEMVIRGVAQRVWKNAPPTLRDIFLNARAFGAREFLVYEDDRATYEAFSRAAIALARQLQADGVAGCGVGADAALAEVGAAIAFKVDMQHMTTFGGGGPTHAIDWRVLHIGGKNLAIALV